MLHQSKEHLTDVNETYGQHLAFALWFGLRMIGAGCAIILHAFIPALFQKTGSEMVIRLHKELESRQAAPKNEGKSH